MELRRVRLRHPDAAELVQCALGDAGGALEEHVRSCPDCRREVTELRAAMAGLAMPSEAAGPCPSDELLAALVEQRLDPYERDRVVEHLGTCAGCRTVVVGAREALAEDAVAAEVRALDGRRRSWPLVAGPIAAAALLLVLLRPAVDDPVHRAPPVTGTPAPVLVTPAGPMEGVRSLRWRGVAEADQYRVTVYDAAGAVIHEAITGDTLLDLPPAVRLESGRSYFWIVAAEMAPGRWSLSDLTEFSIPERP